MPRLRRRKFITLAVGAALTPLDALRAARAQGQRPRRIGVLMGGAEGDPQTAPFLREFRRGLEELGWIEGRNIQIDLRFGASDVDRMQRLAKELVDTRPELIVAHATPVTAAVAREAKTLPIVFVVVSDPVGSRFVASLARPGGNMTGFVNLEASMGGKWIEFLKEISPSLARVAFIYNPDTAPHAYFLDPFEAAARSFGVPPVPAPVRRLEDIETLIKDLDEKSGLAVMPDTFTSTLRVYNLIIALAARQR